MPQPTSYPILTFLYHIYALGEIEQMSVDADAFFDKHGLPKSARKILKHVAQGGSPSRDQLEEFLGLLRHELEEQPAIW